MSDSELQAIRERANAATEGPWGVHANGRMICQSDRDGRPLERRGMRACGDPFPRIGQVESYDDAPFVAHARTDVPALLDENARLRVALAIAENAVYAGAKLAVSLAGERNQALADLAAAQRVADGLAERVARQSGVLSRKAER